MPAQRVFAPPLQPTQLPQLKKPTQFGRPRIPRKRKQRHDEEETETRSSPNDEDEIPSYPFPYAPAPAPKRARTESTFREPPKHTLKTKHLGILTTILHRCLMEGDYARASRAWSMILRTKIRGQSMDARRGDNWGIGSEILLRRPEFSHRGRGLEDEAGESGGNGYGEKAIAAARKYYEQMIVQFPQPTGRKSVFMSDTTFYPPLFSLLIYQVTEESRRAREALDRELEAQQEDEEDPYAGFGDGGNGSREERLKGIQEQELLHAEEIATRIDDLMMTTPYDKMGDLLHLRGMVALWVGDLKSATVSQNSNDNNSMESPDGEEDEDEDGPASRRDDPRTAEIEKAKTFFKRARQNGARVWEGVAHLLQGEEEDSDQEEEEVVVDESHKPWYERDLRDFAKFDDGAVYRVFWLEDWPDEEEW